jgi:hypothetical protein
VKLVSSSDFTVQQILINKLDIFKKLVERKYLETSHYFLQILIKNKVEIKKHTKT